MQVANVTRRNILEKNVFKAIFLILVWLIIISLTKDALQIKRGFQRVEETQNRLEREEFRSLELQDKYKVVRTDEYRERLIREQLNMQKEGEFIAVLPGLDLSESVPKNDGLKEKKTWEKWLDLVY